MIGYGGMARHHFQHIAKDDRMDVIGVYDIDKKRNEVAKEDGLAVYASPEELLADEKIDIVLVATPNNFHRDYLIEAMKAGKHVISEKPVTMSCAELEEVRAVSEKTGKVFTVHQNRRMDKDFLIVKKAFADGVLGNVFSIESRVQGARGVPEGWRQYQVAGGGMLLDWGVHLIDQIITMVPDKVKSIYAHMLSVKYPEVDDYFRLLLRFEKGLSAYIEVSTCTFISLPRWHVSGDKGTLIINDWDCSGKILRAKETEETWEEDIIYTKAGPTKTMAPRRKDTMEELPLVEPENDYTLTYKNLIDHIEGKADLFVTPWEAMRTEKIMEACFESERTGQAVELNI